MTAFDPLALMTIAWAASTIGLAVAMVPYVRIQARENRAFWREYASRGFIPGAGPVRDGQTRKLHIVRNSDLVS